MIDCKIDLLTDVVTNPRVSSWLKALSFKLRSAAAAAAVTAQPADHCWSQTFRAEPLDVDEGSSRISVQQRCSFSSSATCLSCCCRVSREGYHGLYCEEEYNECLSAPCQNYATCRDLINAYECVCTPQFEGTAVGFTDRHL